jgi:hypothetical protein
MPFLDCLDLLEICSTLLRCIISCICFLCCALLCSAVLCFVMLYCAVLCCTLLCYALLCLVVLHSALSYFALLCSAVLCCAVLCLAVPALLCSVVLACARLCLVVLGYARLCSLMIGCKTASHSQPWVFRPNHGSEQVTQHRLAEKAEWNQIAETKSRLSEYVNLKTYILMESNIRVRRLEHEIKWIKD